MKLKKVKKTSVLASHADSDEDKDEKDLMKEHLRKENERNASKVDQLEKKYHYDIDESKANRQSTATHSNGESKFISNLLEAKKQRENDQILLRSFKLKKESENSTGERIETQSFKIYKEEIKKLEEKALNTQENTEQTDPESEGLLAFYKTQLDTRDSERSGIDMPAKKFPDPVQTDAIEMPLRHPSPPSNSTEPNLNKDLNIRQEIFKAEQDLVRQKQSKLLSLLPPEHDQRFLDEAKQRYFQRQGVLN